MDLMCVCTFACYLMIPIGLKKSTIKLRMTWTDIAFTRDTGGLYKYLKMLNHTEKSGKCSLRPTESTN